MKAFWILGIVVLFTIVLPAAWASHSGDYSPPANT